MGFSREQLTRLAPLWGTMLDHRFLTETREGTISDAAFARWMQQDYLFVEAAIPFIAILIPKAPRRHQEQLAAVPSALEKELKLFEDRAASSGIRLRGEEASFTAHAYISFLIATGYRESYPAAFTVLYAAEKAYFDSWTTVKHGIEPSSRWMPFVENWTSEAFAKYVGWLEVTLDELAFEAGEPDLRRMRELFELTTRYEIAFWEMAFAREAWPGVKS